jgi:hypothetical protein
MNKKRMDNNFSIVTEHPTPQELLLMLFDLTPDFRSYWESANNLFVESDGSCTVHGIFAEFSQFVRDNLSEIDEPARKELFQIIEKLVNTNPNFSGGVSNAVCTCFLEHLAGEGELSNTIHPYLGPESRKFLDEWNN